MIAGARFSRSHDNEGPAEGDRATEKLITAQLLVALQNLQPGGDLISVLNVTPLSVYMVSICFYRTLFDKLVAVNGSRVGRLPLDELIGLLALQDDGVTPRGLVFHRKGAREYNKGGEICCSLS